VVQVLLLSFNKNNRNGNGKDNGDRNFLYFCFFFNIVFFIFNNFFFFLGCLLCVASFWRYSVAGY